MRPYFKKKKKKAKRAGSVAKVLKWLLSNHEALSSIPSTAGWKKRMME
jgi:hypothetical protein